MLQRPSENLVALPYVQCDDVLPLAADDEVVPSGLRRLPAVQLILVLCSVSGSSQAQALFGKWRPVRLRRQLAGVGHRILEELLGERSQACSGSIRQGLDVELLSRQSGRCLQVLNTVVFYGNGQNQHSSSACSLYPTIPMPHAQEHLPFLSACTA